MSNSHKQTHTGSLKASTVLKMSYTAELFIASKTQILYVGNTHTHKHAHTQYSGITSQHINTIWRQKLFFSLSQMHTLTTCELDRGMRLTEESFLVTVLCSSFSAVIMKVFLCFRTRSHFLLTCPVAFSLFACFPDAAAEGRQHGVIETATRLLII